MRKVAFQPNGPKIPLYFRDLIQKGSLGPYSLFLHRSWMDIPLEWVGKQEFLYHNAFLRILRKEEGKSGSRLPWPYIKNKLESALAFPKINADLIYSWNHLVFNGLPYVLDQEYITALMGYEIETTLKFRSKINTWLEDHNLKFILCPTQLSRTIIQTLFPNPRILNKLKLVRRAVPTQYFTRPGDNSKIVLLFAGTANEPGAFEYKGGKETVEAFRRIRRQYGTKVKLIIRSDVPNHLKKRILDTDGITLIEDVLPFHQYRELFVMSNLFILPTHITPAVVFLDAMSFGLPVVTTDEAANKEIVIDGKCGKVTAKPVSIPTLPEMLVKPSLEKRWEEEVRRTQWDTVESLTQAISELIDDQNLRRELSLNAKSEIDSGRYSIAERDHKLIEIFNEAVEQRT